MPFNRGFPLAIGPEIAKLLNQKVESRNDSIAAKITPAIPSDVLAVSKSGVASNADNNLKTSKAVAL